MVALCNDTASGMVYADFFDRKEALLIPHPLTDYQEGSLRDDFNFGPLLLFRAEAWRDAVSCMDSDFQHAALYDLRLKISQRHAITHIPEYLYSEAVFDARLSGEKLFDYVDPKNRNVQIEMEQACTNHLKEVGAWLSPVFKDLAFHDHTFVHEVSVIIPVRDRVKTIGNAMASVLGQRCDFTFNLIVVDNFSTDGTTDLIQAIVKTDPRVIHVVPDRRDLGIGGCWNVAINHPQCGKFAIQLDSDDLYIDNTVLTTIRNAFYEQKCAMVVGSYKMVNFDLEEIPPGIIDHREWTPDNGRNNALRINGLGAPRAFYTPVIRSIQVPNVSYGEDYSLGLTISRTFQIGRIYEPLYLCRRWEENSDASLDVQKMNQHDFYKDKIRTFELRARQEYIRKGQPV